jgi:hypothetical protein
MADNIPNLEHEQNAFLAAIGHICLQWALLEQSLLFIIGTIENVPIPKAYKMFAHLDMKPRLNMAILLAQEAKLPHARFIRPLQDIRKALDKDGACLADRRNMFVHGSHQFGQNRGEYILTMSRWKGDKQNQTVTLLDAAQLIHEIILQVQKAQSVFQDYGVWKFGPEYQNDAGEQIAQTKARIRLIRAEQVKRAIKLLLANLRPI